MDAQQEAIPEKSMPVTGANEGVEQASGQGIEYRHGGLEHAQPICDAKLLPPPKRTAVVEMGKGDRPPSLRRCSGSGATRGNSESKANGDRDTAAVGPVGFETLSNRTP